MPILNTIIVYGASSTVLLPFVLALFRRKAVWDYNKWLLIYVIQNFISDAVLMVLAWNKIRNLEVMIACSFIDGLVLLMLYRKALISKRAKAFINLFVPVFTTGFLFIYFYFDASLYIPSYTLPFYQVMMLIPIALYFAQISTSTELYIERNPMFWASCGFLLFYSVNVFYFGLRNYLYHSFPLIDKYGWWVHSLMLIIMSFSLAKAIWTIRKV